MSMRSLVSQHCKRSWLLSKLWVHVMLKTVQVRVGASFLHDGGAAIMSNTCLAGAIGGKVFLSRGDPSRRTNVLWWLDSTVSRTETNS